MTPEELRLIALLCHDALEDDSTNWSTGAVERIKELRGKAFRLIREGKYQL